MKSVLIKGTFLVLSVMALSLTSVTPSQARVKELTCKVEVIDCPGWGTGDRQVCHQNGSGVGCSCGASTNCGEDNS